MAIDEVQAKGLEYLALATELLRSTRAHRLPPAVCRLHQLRPAAAGYSPAFLCGKCVARIA
jgi:hypothetical protein